MTDKTKQDMAGDRIRVNVRNLVNQDMIRKEKRDGRDVIVVKSATLPDDVVMNGILYPAAEIEAAHKTLNDTPAPLGHPTVNGAFVSARSPLGLNLGYFGAWNANARREDGRVFVDKIIDVERANESAMGKRVLAAIDKGGPVHTSTGLLCQLREATNTDLAEYEAFDMVFDHDAILLDEPGAATPDQGVGMMVNKAMDGETEIRAINSSWVEDDADRTIDYLGAELMRAMDRKRDASTWERVKSAVFEAMGLGRETQPLSNEVSEMADQEPKLNDQLAELSAAVKKMAERMDKMEENVNEMAKGYKAKAEKDEAAAKEKRNALVERVVNKGILELEDAQATPDAVLEKLANQKPEAAPGLRGDFTGNKEKFSLAEDWEA